MTVHVTLLTQPDCTLCEHAKQVLARVGADHPLQVQEIRMDSPHGQRLAIEAGVMFAPGILLDGEPYAFGRLSEKALRRDLNRHTTQATETTTHPRK